MSRVTAAEQRALASIWRYGTVKQAAVALGRSPNTVREQLRSARVKLDVATTVEAIRLSRAFEEAT